MSWPTNYKFAKIVKDVLESTKVMIHGRKFINTKGNWKETKTPKSQKSKTLNLEKVNLIKEKERKRKKEIT